MEGLVNLLKRKVLADKKTPVNFLIPWKFVILKKNEKISEPKTRNKPSKSNLILKKFDVISYTEVLSKFVQVLFDKASNYVAITCKQYYVEVILNKFPVLPIFLNSCTPKMKTFFFFLKKKKKLNSDQIITIFGSGKMLNLPLNHWIILIKACQIYCDIWLFNIIHNTGSR